MKVPIFSFFPKLPQEWVFIIFSYLCENYQMELYILKPIKI